MKVTWAPGGVLSRANLANAVPWRMREPTRTVLLRGGYNQQRLPRGAHLDCQLGHQQLPPAKSSQFSRQIKSGPRDTRLSCQHGPQVNSRLVVKSSQVRSRQHGAPIQRVCTRMRLYQRIARSELERLRGDWLQHRDVRHVKLSPCQRLILEGATEG